MLLARLSGKSSSKKVLAEHLKEGVVDMLSAHPVRQDLLIEGAVDDAVRQELLKEGDGKSSSKKVLVTTLSAHRVRLGLLMEGAVDDAVR